MCIAAPARVLALEATDAVVEIDGHRRRASLLLRPEVHVDDWVLVAAGSVIRRIDEAEARDLAQRLAAAVAASRPATPDELETTTPGGPR